MKMSTSTAVAGALAAALTASACGATSTPTTSSNTATSIPASMVLAQTSASASNMPTAAADPHNQADVSFAQQMTIHHQGAIAMADLAPARAASSQVKALAATIKAAQAPEIVEMKRWLASWGAAMSGMVTTTAMTAMAATTTAMSGMAATKTAMSGMAAMPGMMTDQQMTALTAASGAAFDKMFLQLMITHHQGALSMATTEKAHGSNPAALHLADSIITSQTAQIKQMQAMLKDF